MMNPLYVSVFLLTATSLGATAGLPGPPLSVGETHGGTYLASLGGAERPVPLGVPVGNFSPDLFKFKTIVADDGTSDPGGWQQASATLTFINPLNTPKQKWTCNVEVGMPLRTAKWPHLSAEYAAYVAATSATEASSTLISQGNEWVTGLFCGRLGPEMNKYINKWVPVVGQRVVTK